MKAKIQKNKKPISIFIEECDFPIRNYFYRLCLVYVDKEKMERHYDFFYYSSLKEAEQEQEELIKITKTLYFSH